MAPREPSPARLRFAVTADPPGLSLSGEADGTNVDALAALLGPLAAREGHLTIDVTGLSPADPSALAPLVELAAARGTGRTAIVGSAKVVRLLHRARVAAALTVGTAGHRRADGVLRLWSTLDPPGVRVEGTVDAVSQALLVPVLAAAIAGVGGDIHADLADLTVIDVSGLTALVAAARSLPAGRSLIVHHLPDHARHLFDSLGWAQIPALRLEDVRPDPAT